MIRFLESRAGLWAAFAWGLAESTFFFFVPDILFTATALFSFKASLRQIALVLAGALVGGSLMFTWGLRDPERARSAVGKVPFVTGRMLEKVDIDLASSGLWGMCKGPMSGIPYKAYAVRAGKHGSWPLFIIASVPARLERLLLAWLVFTAAAIPLRKRIREHPRVALSLHAVYWAIVYGLFWTSIGEI
jgi:membrane protein YqaA with SNARE-associated domain